MGNTMGCNHLFFCYRIAASSKKKDLQTKSISRFRRFMLFRWDGNNPPMGSIYKSFFTIYTSNCSLCDCNYGPKRELKANHTSLKFLFSPPVLWIILNYPKYIVALYTYDINPYIEFQHDHLFLFPHSVIFQKFWFFFLSRDRGHIEIALILLYDLFSMSEVWMNNK